MDLDEFRTQFPMYSKEKYTDEELGSALYNKHYKGKMDEPTFWEKVKGTAKEAGEMITGAVGTAGKAIPRVADYAATMASGMVTEPVAKHAGMINLLGAEFWGTPEEKKNAIEYRRAGEAEARRMYQYQPRYPETTVPAMEMFGKREPSMQAFGRGAELAEKGATNLLGERAGYGVGAALTMLPFVAGGLEGGVKGATVKGVKPAIRFLDGAKEIVKGETGGTHLDPYAKLKAGQEARPHETGWIVDGKFEKNITRDEIEAIKKGAPVKGMTIEDVSNQPPDTLISGEKVQPDSRIVIYYGRTKREMVQGSLPGKEHVYSANITRRREIGKDFPQYAYEPEINTYNAGTTVREPQVVSGIPHAIKIDGNKIYDGVKDPKGFVASASNLMNGLKVTNPDLWRNIFAKLVRDSGYEGYTLGESIPRQTKQTFLFGQRKATPADVHTVGISGQVQGASAPLKSVQDAIVEGNKTAPGLVTHVQGVLKQEFPEVKYVSHTPQVYWGGESAGEIEPSISLTLDGPLPSVKAAAAYIGATLDQNSVMIAPAVEASKPNGFFVNFKLREKNLAAVTNASRQAGLDGVNLLRNGDGISYFVGSTDVELIQKFRELHRLVGAGEFNADKGAATFGNKTAYRRTLSGYYGNELGGVKHGEARSQGKQRTESIKSSRAGNVEVGEGREVPAEAGGAEAHGSPVQPATAPGRQAREVVPTTTPPATGGLRPAVMFKGRKYEGVEGSTHPDIMKVNDIGPESKHQRGFVTPSGSFMTREQAKTWMRKNRPGEYAAWAKQVEGDVKAPLHSQDLNKAKGWPVKGMSVEDASENQLFPEGTKYISLRRGGKTVYLKNPKVKGEFLTGTEVNREGVEVAPKGPNSIRIQLMLAKEASSITPLVESKMYGTLEPVPKKGTPAKGMRSDNG